MSIDQFIWPEERIGDTESERTDEKVETTKH
jgi:hypothetical protein